MNNRLDLVRVMFDEWGVDALLITTPANRRWLIGFTGSAGLVLVTRGNAIMATDFRYWTQLANEAPDIQLFNVRSYADDMVAFLGTGGAKRIGIESNAMPVAEFRALEKLTDYEWIALVSPVEALRQVKSAEELKSIAAAARITDLAMEQVPSMVRLGMSERELGWLLEKAMREAGADAMAFDVIAASGPNSALPHHHPGDRTLQAGDALIIDMGAALNGYKSDLTRSFYLGTEPTETYWSIYSTVLAAHAAAVANLHGGMNGKASDALGRDVIEAAGYGDRFGHGLGHGVGLEIHENPRMARMREHEIVPTGSVLTIEPGIYIPDYGGVRIEDLVVVTDDGVELLSSAAKTPLIAVA